MAVYYIDPSSDSKGSWTSFGGGAATNWDHINKGTRQPSTPSTATGIKQNTAGQISRPVFGSGVPTFAAGEVCIKATLWFYADTAASQDIQSTVRDSDISVPARQTQAVVGASQSAQWFSTPVDAVFAQVHVTGGMLCDFTCNTAAGFSQIYTAYIELTTVVFDGHYFLDPISDQQLDAGWTPFGTPATATGWDHTNKGTRQQTTPSTASGVQSAGAAGTTFRPFVTSTTHLRAGERVIGLAVWAYIDTAAGGGISFRPQYFGADFASGETMSLGGGSSSAVWRRASHVPRPGENLVDDGVLSVIDPIFTNDAVPSSGNDHIYSLYVEVFTVRNPIPPKIIPVQGVQRAATW